MTTSPMLPQQQPDMVDAHGRAWRLDLATIAAKRPNGPPPELTVAGWIVHAPWAHPVWHSYLVAAISLRKIDGWPAAKINLDGATHEVLVLALDPDVPLAIDQNPRPLMPANFMGQFIEPDDAAAAARIERTVADICRGALSPDTDFVRHWIHRFSASNLLDPSTAGDTRIVIDRQDGTTPTELVIKAQPGPQDMH